ncbi:unnamed protein product (mitochondrion) [Plasmodiophora brassicae]|nr:unnamed protein product [Plasmodiophora brassicae]
MTSVPAVLLVAGIAAIAKPLVDGSAVQKLDDLMNELVLEMASCDIDDAYPDSCGRAGTPAALPPRFLCTHERDEVPAPPTRSVSLPGAPPEFDGHSSLIKEWDALWQALRRLPPYPPPTRPLPAPPVESSNADQQVDTAVTRCRPDHGQGRASSGRTVTLWNSYPPPPHSNARVLVHPRVAKLRRDRKPGPVVHR